MIGKIIVIDGMDGTGKETQSKLLYKKLKNMNKKVELVSLPNYDKDSSYFVKKYLKEGYTKNIDNPMLHCMYFAIDRVITYYNEIKEKYNNGYIIILDRYVLSNIICHLHKSGDKYNFLAKMFSLEHNILGLPKPDITFILKADPEVSNKLIESRYKKNCGFRDIHEEIEIQRKFYNNIKFIEEINQLSLVKSFGKICSITIHNKEGKIHSIDYINNIIFGKVISLLENR